MKEIIGRNREQELINEYLNSNQSEFVAIYGRRRVGKTFLIRKAAKENFAFFVTGLHDSTKENQLLNFAIALQKYSGRKQLSVSKNWLLAFNELSKYLESLPNGTKTVFIDELPWMDTPKSNFVAALENFWNSWAALRDDIKLIVCGSATSWIIDKLINSRGGLHNRLTHTMIIQPFTLSECEQYFEHYGFHYSRKQVAESYMVMGGIPYYLSLMDRSKSLSQNIDYLFFEQNAPLQYEFKDLYRALFKKADAHIAIITALSKKGKGLSRNELIQQTKLVDNGALSTVLEELCQCGFVRQYNAFTQKESDGVAKCRKGIIYQLIDFYTLFYFKFIKENNYADEHFWTNSQNSNVYYTWCGLSFEKLCIAHLPQIKQKLGIAGVLTNVFTWRDSSPSRHSQIDLVIDRKDDTMNICEMKYSKEPYTITKEYESVLQKKLSDFRSVSGTKKALILTFVANCGVTQNQYSDIVQSSVELDDLFT